MPKEWRRGVCINRRDKIRNREIPSLFSYQSSRKSDAIDAAPRRSPTSLVYSRQVNPSPSIIYLTHLHFLGTLHYLAWPNIIISTLASYLTDIAYQTSQAYGCQEVFFCSASGPLRAAYLPYLGRRRDEHYKYVVNLPRNGKINGLWYASV
jgi:hypothetical protein